MTFFDSIRTCYNKYSTFDGRASRSEFWWAFLFFVAALLFIRYGLDVVFLSYTKCMLAWFWTVICFLPLTAVAVRRLHDIGKCAWWLLAVVVGYVVAIVVVVDVVMLWCELTIEEAIESAAVPCCVITIIAAAYFVYVMSQPSMPDDEEL